MTCGIYKLNFVGTTKVYIGQSKHIEKRFSEHLYRLKGGVASDKLQEAYKLFGTPLLEIVLSCLPDELNAAEDEAIEIWNSVLHGFNTLNKAGDMPFPDNSGSNNGRSVYSEEQIIEVFNLLTSDSTIPFDIICTSTGVSKNVISGISTGNSHIWLKCKFPKQYTILENLRPFRKNNHKPLLGVANSSKAKGIVHPKILSPDGVVYTIDSVRGFAREHGLNQGNLHNVLSGKKNSIKGWVVFIDNTS